MQGRLRVTVVEERVQVLTGFGEDCANRRACKCFVRDKENFVVNALINFEPM